MNKSIQDCLDLKKKISNSFDRFYKKYPCSISGVLSFFSTFAWIEFIIICLLGQGETINDLEKGSIINGIISLLCGIFFACLEHHDLKNGKNI